VVSTRVVWVRRARTAQVEDHTGTISAKFRKPAATARAATGTNPAADTRFGSSNPAETAWGLWESCIYEMPSVWWKTEP